MPKIEDDWWTSPERQRALDKYHDRRASIEFAHSKEFADARLAFRRRVNGSPDAETT